MSLVTTMPNPANQQLPNITFPTANPPKPNSHPAVPLRNHYSLINQLKNSNCPTVLFTSSCLSISLSLNILSLSSLRCRSLIALICAINTNVLTVFSTSISRRAAITFRRLSDVMA
jgi:hypothetical protein